MTSFDLTNFLVACGIVVCKLSTLGVSWSSRYELFALYERGTFVHLVYRTVPFFNPFKSPVNPFKAHTKVIKVEATACKQNIEHAQVRASCKLSPS